MNGALRMFSLMGKNKNQSVAAVVPGEMGIVVASLSTGTDKPRLNVCDFSLWEEGSAHEKQLAQKAKEFSLIKHNCTTVMGLGEYTVLSVDAPDVPPNELRAAVRWQVKDLIDYHIDDAVIDVFDAPSSGAHGQQNKLYVVVSRTSTVRERVDQMQDADVNLTTIDIPELVLRNITARLPENEAGVAMVYLTRERGLVVVSRQSTLYFARALDIGYEYLNQGMEGGDGLSLESNAVFDKLVLEVQRSLDYYDRYFSQPPVAGLVLAPTEVPVPGLAEYLTQALGMSARHFDLSEIVDCDIPLSESQQAHCLPAIGAALRQEQTSL
jgi:MSHA biogenesis protein MshI